MAETDELRTVATEDEKIQYHVTRPVEVVRTYDNGNHTISPLGFPVANASGVSNDGECHPDEENPVFVNQSFGVEYPIGDDVMDGLILTANINIGKLYGKSIVVPVKSLLATEDFTEYFIKVDGDFSDVGYEVLNFDATSSDLLVGTGFFDDETHTRDDVAKSVVTATYDADENETTLNFPNTRNCYIESLGEGILAITLSMQYNDSYPVYVALGNQTNPTENGIYIVYGDTEDAQEVYWRRLGSDPRLSQVIDDLTDPEQYPYANKSATDNVYACVNGKLVDHFRKGYSDHEIYKYLDEKVGVATTFGVQSPTVDDGECNGSFVDWFTGNGMVNLSAYAGSDPVFVNAFGLGQLYGGVVVDTATESKEPAETKKTLHPWMFWGYGTKWDVMDPGSNVTALPKDWPFTYISDYAKRTMNNNITLVKEGAVVSGSSTTLGNLSQDVYDEETGEFKHHLEIDRHHVVIYNDLSTVDTSSLTIPDGYTAGTTIVKPTFIHIPAPLTVKDGDTFEVTVSLQNLNPEDFSNTSDPKDLSAYYSLVSQPRVYIVGGYQQFANERYKVIDPTDADVETDKFKLTTKVQVVGEDGNPLPAGTEVRVNLTSISMSPAETTFIGKIMRTNADGTMIEFNGEFPYEIGGRRWHDNTLYICGMAYMGGEELNNPTETAMGLVTRTPEILGSDAGSGESGSLNEFNNFYSLNKELPGRYTFPGKDKRYYLASVYQGSTNTFPWYLNGRKKLSNLKRSLTGEADINYYSTDSKDTRSITYQAWLLNKELLDYADEYRNFHDVTYNEDADGYSFIPTLIPVSYKSSSQVNKGDSLIGAKVRVQLGETVNDMYTGSTGNPVRQAARAYADLIDDFMLTRCGYRNASTDTPMGYTSSFDVGTEERSEMPTANTMWSGRTLTPLDIEGLVAARMSALRLRHVPEYVRDASFNSDYAGVNDDWNTYSTDFQEYFSYSDYCTGLSPYSSTYATNELDCDVAGVPFKPNQYQYRSVVKGIIYSNVMITTTKTKLMNDIFKYAESQESYVSEKMRNLSNHNDSNLNEEIWTPFAKVIATNFIPYPVITESEADGLSDDQKEYVSFDKVYQYKNTLEDTDVEYVSDVMPTSDALASYISKYVAPYAAELPLRTYKSTRIFTAGVLEDDNPIFVTSLKWMEHLFAECGESGNLINRYINDNFAYDTGIEESFDRNMNWNKIVPDGVTDRQLEMNAAAAPYSIKNALTDRMVNRSTYTRVFMQFTFSAKAGRWYTTEYRQAPTTYLSPLYGADAFKAQLPTVCAPDGSSPKLDGYGNSSISDYVWTNSMCNIPETYRTGMYMPYSSYLPMDITLGCVPYLFTNFPYDSDGKLKDEFKNTADCYDESYMRRLAHSYKPINQSADVVEEDVGLSLYPPSDANGGYSIMTDDGPHANFWCVRKYLRPAVSALDGTDVPSPESYTGGVFSDPTLYSMFDEPTGMPRYHVPDPENPMNDLTTTYLIWHDGDGETEGLIKAHELASEPLLTYVQSNGDN